MSGIALSIALDKPDRTYEAGETITGRVNVSVSEKIQAGALVLVLSCKGISKAENIHRTIEKEKAEIKLFQGSWMPEEYIYPFEIVAPADPRTYQGKIFDVTWHLGAKVRSSQGKDLTAEEEITLIPKKRMPHGEGATGSEEVVHRQSAKNSVGCFSLSLILAFAGIYFTWRAFLVEQKDMDLFFVGGLIALILGLVALFLLTYSALVNKRIKKAEIILGSRQASPGEKIPFSLTFEANIPFQVDKIRATLRGKEIVDFFSSKNKKHLSHCLYENRQELPLAVKQVPARVPIRVEGEVLIPEGVPCSMSLVELRNEMAIQSEIEFVIEMKKWTDWIHFEHIAVQYF